MTQQTEAEFKAHCLKTYGKYTEEDAKFFALRAGGYIGPIDQDGNAADDDGTFASFNQQGRAHGVAGY
jgi:hypothetical protein